MLKKLFLILLILLNLFIYKYSFADDQQIKDTLNNAQTKYESASKSLNDAQNELKKFNKEDDFYATAKTSLDNAEETLKIASEELNQAKNDYDNSGLSQNDITSRGFQVGVGELTPGDESSLSGKSTTEVINMTLGNIIQKLMIGLGSFALLIMTVGGGYMVIYHGQDELLSKGKSMFIGGITGLVIALSSYYIIDLLRFILYK